MPTYEVQFTLSIPTYLHCAIDVEANSPQEAARKVNDIYNQKSEDLTQYEFDTESGDITDFDIDMTEVKLVPKE